MGAPSSVCLVKLGAIGDVVNSLPLLNRLRRNWPETRISWVIAPLAHKLVAGHSQVDQFLVFDVKRRATWPSFWRQLRSNEFELAIDLQRILKSALLTRATGAARRLGFDRARCKESSWLFTNERIAPQTAPAVTVAQYLEFADHLRLDDCAPEWNLPVTAWRGARPRVCLGIGASKSANLWPIERWIELTRRLVEERGRAPLQASDIYLSGGPEDRARADELLAKGPQGMTSTAGTLNLKESAGLIAASDVFVGGDTGPMHIAVAVGTPLVTLFGAADPQRTGPFGRPHAVVYEPAECSPCRQRDCTVAGHPCMVNITVERVLREIDLLLATSASAASGQ